MSSQPPQQPPDESTWPGTPPFQPPPSGPFPQPSQPFPPQYSQPLPPQPRWQPQQPPYPPSAATKLSARTLWIIGIIVLVFSIAGIAVANGNKPPSTPAQSGTTQVVQAPTVTPTTIPTAIPTATPISSSPTPTPSPSPTPTATPTPQVPMLGGLKAPFDAKYGQGVYSSDELVWEYHYDSPNDSRALWLTLDGSVADPNKARVVHIELGDNETWNDQTAAAHCNAFLPADARLQQTVIVGGGPDYEKVYLSKTEANLFTPDYFTDPNEKPVKPGTIYVQFFHDGTSHITGCTLGLGTNT